MDIITSRAVRGMMMQALSVDSAPSWVNGVSNFFTSDQASENYGWLSDVAAMREWVGERQAKTLSELEWTIANKHFEDTLEFSISDMRRDKINAIQTRINELAVRASTHEASLLSQLILDGIDTACYDGQFYFDTDHEEGDSGTQSNDISIDISTLPVATGGTITAPSPAEMQLCIAQGITQIAGFVDGQGEPMNENARQFVVMVPMSLYMSAVTAVTTPMQVAETQTALQGLKTRFSVTVEPNVRLSSWTDEFAIFRTDAPVKALIRQQETNLKIGSLAEGSDFAFKNDAHQYGVSIWRNVAYGRWQNACLVTMT